MAASVTVGFNNQSSSTVQLYWRDGDNLTFYRELQPGEAYDQPTFVGHKWIAILIQGRQARSFTAPGSYIQWPLNEIDGPS